MRAVIYCRVSTTDQVDGTSLDTQETACRRWCEHEGVTVEAVYRDEGHSAKTRDRPGLIQAIDHARRQRPDVLLVWKIDRLSRSQLDFHQLRALLAGYGVQVKSATETLTDDPAGRFLAGMLAAVAQFDNDVRAERTREGMKAAAQAGGWVWRAPIGYQNSRTPDGAPSLEPDANAPLVRRAFELVAEGRSQAATLRHLTQLGLEYQGSPIHREALSRMLRKRVYVGQVESTLVGPEPVPGNWQPIVSEDMFSRVQAALGEAEAETRRRDRPDFPLKGWVHCAECGRPLTASYSTGRNGTRYPYYRCYKHTSISARKGDLENALLDALDGLRVAPGLIRLWRAVVLDVWRERRSDVAEARQTRRDRIAALTARKDRLVDLLLDNRIDDETYNRQAERIGAKLADLRAQEMAGACEEMDVEATLDFAVILLNNPGRMWRAGTLAQRQALQRFAFPDGGTWDGERLGTDATHRLFKDLRAELAQGVQMVTLDRPGWQRLRPLVLDVERLRRRMAA